MPAVLLAVGLTLGMAAMWNLLVFLCVLGVVFFIGLMVAGFLGF